MNFKTFTITIVIMIVSIVITIIISYGGAAAVPDRSIVSALTGVYLDSLYYLGPAGGIFALSLLFTLSLSLSLAYTSS